MRIISHLLSPSDVLKRNYPLYYWVIFGTANTLLPKRIIDHTLESLLTNLNLQYCIPKNKMSLLLSHWILNESSAPRISDFPLASELSKVWKNCLSLMIWTWVPVFNGMLVEPHLRQTASEFSLPQHIPLLLSVTVKFIGKEPYQSYFLFRPSAANVKMILRLIHELIWNFLRQKWVLFNFQTIKITFSSI